MYKEPMTGQVLVSLVIVAVMCVIGLGLIVAAALTNNWSTATGGVSTIIGALATALNSPTGISAAIRSMKDPPA